jgi:hypothetical protein
MKTVDAMIKWLFRVMVGWGRKLKYIDTSPALDALSELRLRTCSKCGHSGTSKILQLTDSGGAYEDVISCKICHCPCRQKTLVIEEKCPIGRW